MDEVIRIEAVERIFSGAAGPVRALDGVSLSVGRGEIFGIIGFSGAGKSTLLRLINGLERPDRGTVQVMGSDLAQLSAGQILRLRRRIGMIFQQFNLLASADVFANVALPLRLAHESAAVIRPQVEEALSFVGLADRAHARIDELSGGQKQRVGIARALVTSPEILLCDEATSALDPRTTEQILDLLGRINAEKGITIVLITHQMSVIEAICNQVAVMEAGRIVEQGRVRDIFGAPSAPITRDFVRTVLSDRIPGPLLKEARSCARHYHIVRLKFVGMAVRRPIIAGLCRRAGLEVNILGASVEELDGTVMCVYFLQLIGAESTVGAAEHSLDGESGLHWEVMEIRPSHGQPAGSAGGLV